jgi:hypothetical protein
MHFPAMALRAMCCSILVLLLSLVAAPSARAATTGEIKTAVILVNFTDAAAPSNAPAELDQLVFGKVSDFYWEASYQKTFLGGDTFGWFTIPVSTTQCTWDKVASEGNRAAAAAGANLSSYTTFVYLFPTASACINGGGGDIGPNGEHRVFVNGASGFTEQMISHELGHQLGLQHSDGLDCDVSALGNTCVQRGYTDTADTMGGHGHFNAFQKERLGWLNAAGAPPITTVSASGRYAIERYETPGTGAKALKILKSVDPVSGQKTWYYLEYRQPIGFDSVLAGLGNLTTGVQVRTGTLTAGGIGTSLLLDMTASSNATIAYDIWDGALGVGRTYSDGSAAVSFTVVSADANGAVVDVTMAASPPPACVRAAPALAVTGPTSALAAGSSAAYTVSVSTRDSSGCASTTFALARSVPSGWSGALGATSLTLSPGATASTTLTVVSPSTAAAGTYVVGTGTGSAAGAVHTASASASYTIASRIGGKKTRR